MSQRDHRECCTCIYWQATAEAIGSCRRWPATLESALVTGSDDWCGEYQAVRIPKTAVAFCRNCGQAVWRDAHGEWVCGSCGAPYSRDGTVPRGGTEVTSDSTTSTQPPLTGLRGDIG